MTTFSFSEIYAHLDVWATERGIDNIQMQYLKYKEESGELAASILKGRTQQIEDDLGDTIVTILMVARLAKLGKALALGLDQIDRNDFSIYIGNPLFERISHPLIFGDTTERVAVCIKELDTLLISLSTFQAEDVAEENLEQESDLKEDCELVLLLLARELNLDPLTALNAAWNEIKDRRGKTVNGSFVKTADL